MSNCLKAGLAFALIAAGAGPAWAQQRASPASRQAAGPSPRIVRPASEESLQWSASVVQVDMLRRQGNLTAKLFGDAAGDPAMNGLNTYLAFFGSPDQGWIVFEIGDFLSYQILSEARGRIVLEIDESVMNQGTGAISSRVRRLTISWTAGRGGEPPTAISVARDR